MDTPTTEVMCPTCNVPMVNGVCPQCGMKAEDVKVADSEVSREEAAPSSEMPAEEVQM